MDQKYMRQGRYTVEYEPRTKTVPPIRSRHRSIPTKIYRSRRVKKPRRSRRDVRVLSTTTRPKQCMNDGPAIDAPCWDDTTNPAAYVRKTCRMFRIKRCQASKCKKVRHRLERVAPRWTLDRCPGLRDWVLDFASCWIAHRDCQTRPPRLESAVQFCAEFIYKQSWSYSFLTCSSLGICDLFQWVGNLEGTPGSWGSRAVFGLMPAPKFMSMMMQQGNLDVPNGVCKHRYWTLGMACSRGALEMVSLNSMLSLCTLTPRHVERHQDCTVQVCLQNDENTTIVPQLHLCENRSCTPIVFPVHKANHVDPSERGSTAWSIVRDNPKLGSDKYMAVSHVWSDGTGVGLDEVGRVNRCLLRMFRELAASPEIGCDGIWWDAISLPGDKNQRKMALNTMNLNFSRATCTLVHDLELSQFCWADDGSPCMALAFSTWFSRGWTALELYASRKVWVLFRNANGRRILKDLDKDILAHKSDPFAHPAHKAISQVIRRLRPGHSRMRRYDYDAQSLKLQELLNVLRQKHTCWPRDRSIIAGLMIGNMWQTPDWFDSSWSLTTITRNILTKCEYVSPFSLFHNQVPQCSSGPWSWCPSLIFDLNVSQSERFFPLAVKEGRLHGPWFVIKLDERDVQHLVPHAAHTLQATRVQEALRRYDDHRLLYPTLGTAGMDTGPFVVAKILGKKRLGFVGVANGTISSKSRRELKWHMVLT